MFSTTSILSIPPLLPGLGAIPPLLEAGLQIAAVRRERAAVAGLALEEGAPPHPLAVRRGPDRPGGLGDHHDLAGLVGVDAEFPHRAHHDEADAGVLDREPPGLLVGPRLLRPGELRRVAVLVPDPPALDRDLPDRRLVDVLREVVPVGGPAAAREGRPAGDPKTLVGLKDEHLVGVDRLGASERHDPVAGDRAEEGRAHLAVLELHPEQLAVFRRGAHSPVASLVSPTTTSFSASPSPWYCWPRAILRNTALICSGGVWSWTAFTSQRRYHSTSSGRPSGPISPFSSAWLWAICSACRRRSGEAASKASEPRKLRTSPLRSGHVETFWTSSA